MAIAYPFTSLRSASAGRSESNTPTVTRRERVLHLVGWYSLFRGVASLFTPAPRKRTSSDSPRAAKVSTDHDVSSANDRDVSSHAAIALAVAAVVGAIAAGVFVRRLRHQRADRAARTGTENSVLHVQMSQFIRARPDTLYDLWRNIAVSPRLIPALKSVVRTEEDTVHWVAETTRGSCVEWQLEVLEQQPASLIAWRTLENSPLSHWGTVRFEWLPKDRGTLVHIDMHYDCQRSKMEAMPDLTDTLLAARLRDVLRLLGKRFASGEAATIHDQPAPDRTVTTDALMQSES
jgi:uncharacterized membrane protein